MMDEHPARPGRFRPAELVDDLTAGEQAEALSTARELEWLAAIDDITPSSGFADRVMAAVADEPTPRPVSAAASAARRGAILGVLAAFRDLWRVAWTGGRPLAVRAPAMALILLVMAGVIGAGAIGAGALAGLIAGPDRSPAPTEVASPSPAVASPSSSPAAPSASPGPGSSASPRPSPSPGASPTSTPSAAPSQTAAPTARPTSSPRPSATPRPTSSSRPSATPSATSTPEPSESPRATTTPEPSATPRPTKTPEATASPAGG